MTHPTRSVDYQSNYPVVVSQKNSCCESAAKMRCLGKVFFAGVVVCGAITVAGGIIFSGFLADEVLLITVCVTGSAGAITFLALGIFLHKKKYWNDPKFRNEQKQEVIKTLQAEGYLAARAKHSKILDTYHLLEKSEIHDLLFKGCFAKATFLQMMTDQKNPLTVLIKDGIIAAQELKPIFLGETLTLSIAQITKTYGWLPFSMGCARADDRLGDGPSFKERFLDEIRDKTLNEVVNVYGSIKDIVTNGFADTNDLRVYVINQIRDDTLTIFFAKFGWKLLDDGIVPLELANAAAHEELKNIPFSQFFMQTGMHYDLLFKILTVKELRPYVITELKKSTFAAFIKACGWQVFGNRLLTAEDSEVKEKFIEHMCNCSLLEFFSEDYLCAKHYGLIPSEIFTRVDNIYNRFMSLKADNDQRNRKIEEQYKKQVQAFEQACEAKIRAQPEMIFVHDTPIYHSAYYSNGYPQHMASPPRLVCNPAYDSNRRVAIHDREAQVAAAQGSKQLLLVKQRENYEHQLERLINEWQELQKSK
jgi:hypothetical protein